MGKRNKHHHESVCYRNFRHFSSKHLIADLHNIPWSVLNMFDYVNDKLNIWTTLFMDVINEHIPLVKRRVKINAFKFG